ncbi:phosphomevalonate kinase [Streptococcus caprae]|uniref:phosphomevalonate kinase n=1 Tax=Streptococcus caprae TaxID=1640501 RepID=A0ABV8CUV3_9STRE
MTITRVQTPGKLYLAGEYAILWPGQTALIKSIPIYMIAKIEAADTFEIRSDMFDYSVGRKLDGNYSLIQETIDLFEDYSDSLLPPFNLQISGKMERDGKKLGIGSSGSVVILTLKALAEWTGMALSADTLFKLASAVLLRRGDNGSMGDLACISYEGLIAYRSFDRQRVAQWLSEHSLSEVLKRDWGYVIEPVQVAEPVTFLAGWTQEPAISKDLINLVQSSIDEAFLSNTQEAVLAIKAGLEAGDSQVVAAGLNRVHELLTDLHPAIYSEKLQALRQASQGLGAVAKSSGAGGGDCGVALLFDERNRNELVSRWETAGIEILHEEILGKEG